MGKKDQPAQGEADGDDPAPDSEELRATVEVDIAGRVRFRATARTTPAGVVAAALVTAAATIPLIWIARRR
ncbi:hypothetical protein [Acidisoma sp. 7E03]